MSLLLKIIELVNDKKKTFGLRERAKKVDLVLGFIKGTCSDFQNVMFCLLVIEGVHCYPHGQGHRCQTPGRMLSNNGPDFVC